MTKTRQPLCIVHYALCIAFAALAAKAITQAEWEADNSLIPTPSASSAFYVAAPSPLSGEQEIDALTTGLDATPTEREYVFAFATELNTHPRGTVLFLR